MSGENEKKEKKGGFWSSLGGLARGGSSAAGGLGSSGGSAGGLAGLFAGKTGLAGLLLGGATMAAGIGVVYNFMGSSDKTVYNQGMFQNSYYEEEAARAGKERAEARSAGVASSIDVFREQARKDGLGGLEAADGEAPAAEAEAPQGAGGEGADAAAGAPGGSAGGGAPRMVASPGFAAKGGGAGGGSAMPRMQGGGGLSGGIGKQFQSVYRPPAQAGGGKLAGMTASAARVKNSPKYAVPNFNKKGAFGQAKFARNMGNQAKYSSDVGARGQSGIPYDSSQQTGSGDANAPEMGSGLGGAGVSNGAKLKGNDPSLSNTEVTPPAVPDPENVSPWQKTLNMIMYAMLIAAALIMAANMAAKSYPLLSQILATLAMVAAAVVMIGAVQMMSKYGQKWTGMMYIVLGGALMYMANEARTGASKDAPVAKEAGTKAAVEGQAGQTVTQQMTTGANAPGGAQTFPVSDPQAGITVTELPPSGTTPP